jgi:hypothetical protein
LLKSTNPVFSILFTLRTEDSILCQPFNPTNKSGIFFQSNLLPKSTNPVYPTPFTPRTEDSMQRQPFNPTNKSGTFNSIYFTSYKSNLVDNQTRLDQTRFYLNSAEISFYIISIFRILTSSSFIIIHQYSMEEIARYDELGDVSFSSNSGGEDTNTMSLPGGENTDISTGRLHQEEMVVLHTFRRECN